MLTNSSPVLTVNMRMINVELWREGVSVCVCVCVRACVLACVCVCV